MYRYCKIRKQQSQDPGKFCFPDSRANWADLQCGADEFRHRRGERRYQRAAQRTGESLKEPDVESIP